MPENQPPPPCNNTETASFVSVGGGVVNGKIQDVEICGHRGVGCSVVGGASRVPENSIAAFESAILHGLKTVELDVWLTKDEEVIVIHGNDEGHLYDTVIHEFQRTSSLAFGGGSTGTEISSHSYEKEELTRTWSNLSSTDNQEYYRIEDMNYGELIQSGQLKLRQSWYKYRLTTCSDDTFGVDPVSISSHSAKTYTYPFDPMAYPKRCVQKKWAAESYRKHNIAENIPLEAAKGELGEKRNSNLRNFQTNFNRFLAHDGRNTDFVERVPRLYDLFKLFYGFLTFNVELKGTKQNLGPKVLQIAQMFPGIISRISSFHWQPPQQFMIPFSIDSRDNPSLQTLNNESGNKLSGCSNDSSPHDTPNYGSRKNSFHTMPSKGGPDLLLPIINNIENIPLALLFTEVIPSVDCIMKSLEKYNACWIHLPHNPVFQSTTPPSEALPSPDISQETSQGENAQFVEEFGALSTNVEAVGGKLKDSLSLNAANDVKKELEEDELDDDEDKELTINSAHFKSVVNECRKKAVKIMIYTNGHMCETPYMLRSAFGSGVDSHCVNDVALAMELIASF